MGADRGGTKSGGFFHLFDWNQKSRKKLFSSGSVSPENTKQDTRNEDNLPTSRLRLVDDDETTGVSSGKGSSDYSCASSVTDEEGIVLRAPGVVARLMGLDSMPTAGISEPSSTPFFNTQSLRDKRSHKRSPEFYINDQFNHIVHRADRYAWRPMELRAQKMPSSPIERFQTETLPPRSAKSLPMTHHKLLSPIKNPGFISPKNAAHIMEAAAKILDPGNQQNARVKVASFSPSSIPLRVRDSKENMVVSQSHRTSNILESARASVYSTDFRYLRGQPSNKSWNGPEDTPLRRPPDVSDSNPADLKGKGKSISLAIQAKVNVQRRGGLSSSSVNSSAYKEHDECNFGQPFKSQPNNHKNKQQKKPSATNVSSVLRQNNQKQNCTSSKGKLSSKQMGNQHGRKVLSGDTSSTKTRTLSKLSGNSRVGQRKECSEGIDFEREGLSSSNKDFPRKKRLIERGFISEKSGFIDNVLVDRHQKRVQPNVVIDGHSCSRWKEDNRSDGADVVSFTFTSPLLKPMSASRFSTLVAENSHKGNMYCFDTYNQKKHEDMNDKKLSSHGLNVISGDALSLLLERKLRELTSGLEPSYGSIINDGSFIASSPISQEPVSDITTDTASSEHEMKFHLGPQRDKPGSVFGYGVSSINSQMYGASKLQGSEECSISSDARKEHASPFSILEASSSVESYYPSESLHSIDGIKACSSSIQAQNNLSFNSVNKSPFLEIDMELSDSASSTLTENSDVSELSKTSCTKESDQDLDYVKEILLNTASASTDSYLHPSVLAGDKLNPLLFDKLEDMRRAEDKDGRLRRRMLFDCVDEFLDSKCSRYFRSGYQSWSRGAAVIRKESLAREIYDEIAGWTSMGDWMVDTLVDKDMSSQLGKWVDYDIEAFEAGVEIENEIINSLVNEFISDFL